jgi:UDP-N-acetylmuramate--alanine ligase
VTRAAEAIGAGLAPARPARAIGSRERIHVVGVAGAGASAAALLAARAGAQASGCDPGGPSPYVPPLLEAGVPLTWAHDPLHVTAGPHPDRLAVTKALTAVAPDHPELVAARDAGIPLEPWQQVVADAASGRTLGGVAGTHGKSTTSGWLVHLLVAVGADPSAFVGALLPAPLTGGAPATARQGGGAAFVVEADEYAGNFDPYRPDIAVLTGAEWDHPDVFADLDAVVDAFEAWLRSAAATVRRPRIVLNVGDPGGARVAERLADTSVDALVVALEASDPAGATRGVALGRADGPDAARSRTGDLADRYATAAGPARVMIGRIVAADPSGTDLVLLGQHPRGGDVRVRLATAGRHNAANAMCVLGAATALGIPIEAAAVGLSGFSGVGRRLERKGSAADVVVYDDYGHHPTAIRETLAALRQREPGRPIWAVYEPLTFHRTAALLEPFADALATADGVAVADIWAGRDPDTSVATPDALAEAVARRRPDIPVAAPGPVEATARWLAGHVRPGEAVLVMGGGRSYRIAELLLEHLEGGAR